MSEDKDATFVESVLRRPRMYTLNGTFEEAIVFLEGFYNGMAAHNKHPEAKAESHQWFAFSPWIATHGENITSTAWCDLFPAFRRAYADETAALTDLIRIWREFCTHYNAADAATDHES